MALKARPAGDVVVAAVPLVNLGLWILAPPDAGGSRTDHARQVFGEAVGSTVVLLLAIALVLSTRARFLERPFGGLDKMYRAHRRAGQAAVALLILHAAVIPWRLTPGGGVPAGLLAFAGFLVLTVLTVGPRLPVLRGVIRIGYRNWRRTHRFIGLFFIMALAHTVLVRPLASGEPLLFVPVLAAYVVGIACYLYDLLLAWLFRPVRRYRVEAVRRLNDTTVEVAMRPRRRRRLGYRSGQFVFATFRRWGLREPHPFTVSSAPGDPMLRLTIKAAGDFTGRLRRTLTPGTRATVEGGYGMLDYRRGGRHQVWVAGGIGLTPFLSWLRDLPAEPDRDIDFFYTVRNPADVLFWEEIRATASESGGRLRAHLHLSSRDGPLTVARVAEAARGPLPAADVYLCGPVPLVRAFRRDLRRARVPGSSVHVEEFSFR